MKQELINSALNYHIYSVLAEKQNDKTLTYILLTDADSYHVLELIHKYIGKALKIFEIRTCNNSDYNQYYNSFNMLKLFANTQFKDPDNALNALYIINTKTGTFKHTYNAIIIKEFIDNLIKAKNKTLTPRYFVTKDESNDLNSTRVYQHQHLKFYKKEN